MTQRSQNSGGGIKTGQHIGDSNPHFRRFPIDGAGQAHQAAIRLREQVIAGLVRIRAGLTEACNRTVYEAGEFCSKILIRQAVFCKTALFEILYQDVRMTQQIPNRGDPF